MVECYNLSIELFFRKKDARINYEEIDFFSYLIKSRDMKIRKRFTLWVAYSRFYIILSFLRKNNE